MKDENSQTLLSRTAGHRHEAIVKLLLETGKVKADLKDQFGQTPLAWAANNRHEAVIKLLLDADSKDKCGQTPLARAAVHGHDHEHQGRRRCNPYQSFGYVAFAMQPSATRTSGRHPPRKKRVVQRRYCVVSGHTHHDK